MRNARKAGSESMRRWSFNLAASLSLVLCAAMIVLWVRSYRTADRIRVNAASYPFTGNDPDLGPMFKDRITETTVVSNYGSLDIDIIRSTGDGWLGPDNLKDWKEVHPEGTFVLYDRSPADPSDYEVPLVADALFDHCGLFVCRYSIEGMARGTVDFTGHFVSVRMWLLATLAAVLPALRLPGWFATVRRRRWVRQGRCACCGYDLRATRDCCPECGTTTAEAKR
jgi:hypothetical protein